MCGIIAILEQDIEQSDSIKSLISAIANRGPDYKSPLRTLETKCGFKIVFGASVLRLMGKNTQEQPVIDTNGSVLLFNGQAYRLFGKNLDRDQSDTKLISGLLSSCKSNSEIANVFSNIDGPFSFIYWSNITNSLIFGRDFFGRKSLCKLDGNDPQSMIISSLGFGQPTELPSRWIEVDCSGIHCYNFTGGPKAPKSTLFQWNIDSIYRPMSGHVITKDPDTEYIRMDSPNINHLNSDDRARGEFSDEQIDDAISSLEKKVIDSVGRRLLNNWMNCLDCRTSNVQTPCTHSKVIIAFSGGLDSTVIALAVHKILDASETIDLATVAFKDESPDRESVGSAFRELRRICPKRNWRLILGDISVDELKSRREETIKNLISPCCTVVDDSLGCGCWFISRARGRILDSQIEDEVFNSLFESFLKFNPGSSEKIYSSPASILFAGMGIDEQLGGYSSHRAAYSKGGINGLYEEINRQMRRISSRNLGRDDRCCSDHGRDVKLPYLDFDLVSYLNQLPISIKMNLDEPNDTGPKKILRQLAMRWGLSETGRRVKRALQFGTRIANLENPREQVVGFPWNDNM